MSELGWDEWWIGKGNREDWIIPILELRTLATTSVCCVAAPARYS